MDIKNTTAEKLESALGTQPKQVIEETKKPRSTIYKYRNKEIFFYKIMLLGVRVAGSNLTTREFMRMLKDAESLKGKK